MKKNFIALLCLFSFKMYAQGITDGPYIFHQGDKIIAKTIENDVIKVDTIAKNSVIKVSVQDHSEWNFTVQLRESILPEPAVSKQPKKILFLSDIEGEFAALRLLLLGNKVIDSNYNWIFGKGQLVICGDLFDRGKGVVPVLWLLYKLEEDAKAQGGYVHTILGNHDMMNLSGDFRYVQPKYLTIAKQFGLNYSQLYTPETELGRWLMSKNIVEKIGDNLCLHGGVSPAMNSLGLSLKEINNRFRPHYANYGKTNHIGDKTLINFLKTGTSLFWYRGYFSEPKATPEDVDATLKLFKVKRVVVGHTIVKTNIGFYYNKKVLGVDVNQHAGDHRAALCENKNWYQVDEKGEKVKL